MIHIRRLTMNNNNTIYRIGDKIVFKADFKKKTIDVYHNRKRLMYSGQPIFKNIPDKITPVVSNNSIPGEFSIKYVNPKDY